MTVALSDTKLLYDMLRPLSSFSNPSTTALATSRFYTERKPMSATINTLANALYRVILTLFVSSRLSRQATPQPGFGFTRAAWHFMS